MRVPDKSRAKEANYRNCSSGSSVHTEPACQPCTAPYLGKYCTVLVAKELVLVPKNDLHRASRQAPKSPLFFTFISIIQ